MQPQQQKKRQLIGKIYNYDMQNNSIAFTNDIQSKIVIIFIGGLGDTILSVPFASELSQFCTEKKIRLIIPQFRSMPNFKTFRIEADVEDLRLVVQQLSGKKVVLLGHSTGCQVSLLYLKTHGASNISHVILQAPVSDVEYQQSVDPQLQEQLKQARKTEFFIPQSDDQIWLSQRFLSLYERFNTEDLFSCHLQDQKYISWKQYKTPITSIVCGADKYCVKSNVDKLKLGSQVFVIEGASHSLQEPQSRKQFFRILSQKIL